MLEALADAPGERNVKLLAVNGLPGSGTATELMDAAGIGRDDIVRAALAQ